MDLTSAGPSIVPPPPPFQVVGPHRALIVVAPLTGHSLLPDPMTACVGHHRRWRLEDRVPAPGQALVALATRKAVGDAGPIW